MGYCSDVVLAVRDTVTCPNLPILDECPHVYRAYGYTYYTWYCTKWYDIYDDVSALNTWLDSIDEDDYYLLRKGEELDDVESQGYMYDADIWIEICTPRPIDPVPSPWNVVSLALAAMLVVLIIL
jgi:hypothetical protein